MSGPTSDTIFALSSGSPPAGIAVIRISGPRAGEALKALAGPLPPTRRASYRPLNDLQSGELLDRAIVIWFPGPATATGEDLAELHLHGGRSVIAGVLGALGALPGLRAAEAGEFTRRAFENGRIDLAETEGLSDLLTAETAAQRRSALRMAGGALSRVVEAWQASLMQIAAQVEAALDFSDESDVEETSAAEAFSGRVRDLADAMQVFLSRPSAQRLKDGIRVVLAGPPNAGKSSLINALAQRDVAIVSDVPGTTRDMLDASVSLAGVAFVLSDTAGLRDSADEVEAIGVERARSGIEAADIVLWLGRPEEARDNAIVVRSKMDLGASGDDSIEGFDVCVSAKTGDGLPELIDLMVARASSLLPGPDELALNERQREHLAACHFELLQAAQAGDLLIGAEHLRLARQSLDRVTGKAGVENMLDALFGAFCIGK